jgi:uncharacterized membrane protein YuzA (DUF378 family)
MDKPSTTGSEEQSPKGTDSNMRIIKPVALLLTIVGALNWLLVGIAQFDLVATLTGDSFGDTNVISSIIYFLVGVSGVALLPTLVAWVSGDETERVTA